ncbi:PA2778 family cysteine peptidase [Marinobacter oulmenensis]|uniref:Tetratricopeptide (TPR) repeat protein n=1 Tax=Marinobacter oulmenensis TaxID=643747 RepID=A0A840UL19_9GAMM|nr:PA2778 family cysteine peptidase [Marinobacter oulmenensis]MBB5321418.1 tetratricopeptide (TPR) repeat protein [Marinobacter oulmenensis]
MAVVLTVMALAGCASAPPWPEDPAGPADTVVQSDADVLVPDVPFYPQEKYQCGPAALATVLNTQGLNTSPEELKDKVYIPGREGSLQVELVATARDYGMLVYPLEPEVDNILAEVSAGNPVLVMQNLGLDWWPQWHFAVVVGYNHDAQTLILNTDTREHYAMAYDVFHATWNRAERWAVVALPPSELPATAQPVAFLRSAHDLETTRHYGDALTAYQAAEQRWPDTPTPLLAQGNLEYSLANTDRALGHFTRLVDRFRDYAPGWNNLAHALDSVGCQDGAQKALSCAMELAPNTFDDEDFSRSTPGMQSCPPVPECPVAPGEGDTN